MCLNTFRYLIIAFHDLAVKEISPAFGTFYLAEFLVSLTLKQLLKVQEGIVYFYTGSGTAGISG